MLKSLFCNVSVLQFSGMPDAYETGDADNSPQEKAKSEKLIAVRSTYLIFSFVYVWKRLCVCVCVCVCVSVRACLRVRDACNCARTYTQHARDKFKAHINCYLS